MNRLELILEHSKHPIPTQISSKYSPNNPGVFAYKKCVDAVFPRGDSILKYRNEFAITTNDEAVTSFDKTQIDFFRQIRRNLFHVVYNINGDDEGYLGESGSVETAYAVIHNKPVMLARKHQLHFGERVDPEIREFILRNLPGMASAPYDLAIPEFIAESERDMMRRRDLDRERDKRYIVTDEDKVMVMRNVLGLTRKYREAWYAFQEETSDKM